MASLDSCPRLEVSLISLACIRIGYTSWRKKRWQKFLDWIMNFLIDGRRITSKDLSRYCFHSYIRHCNKLDDYMMQVQSKELEIKIGRRFSRFINRHSVTRQSISSKNFSKNRFPSFGFVSCMINELPGDSCSILLTHSGCEKNQWSTNLLPASSSKLYSIHENSWASSIQGHYSYLHDINQTLRKYECLIYAGNHDFIK